MSFRNRKSSVMPFPDRVFQGRALKESFAREDHIYLDTVCDVSHTISGTARLNRGHTKMVFKKVYTGSIQIGWMSKTLIYTIGVNKQQYVKCSLFSTE
ncbi:hypothetical protein TNCT_291721 [Trichonephila clavata]|uniref:Uncharacterized protein n=1 Tax=Trichonephila clavata TaxID=2740835 RepID=A0A8X6LAM9_TRICU|nr:hypothetical protein TNCT_291721 [Trichonephila clavata]